MELIKFIAAAALVATIGTAQAALVSGTFSGYVMGNGATHGIIQGVEVSESWAGTFLSGTFQYESSAINQLGSSAPAYLNHYQYSPSTPIEITLNVLGYTFKTLGDGMTYVWVGNNYYGHNWYEVGAYSESGAVGRVLVENFLGMAGQYASDITDISNVAFTESVSSPSYIGTGYLLYPNQSGQLGNGQGQLQYFVTSMSVGNAFHVPVPPALILMLTGLGLLGLTNRFYKADKRA